MYIDLLRLKNIRTFKDVTIQFVHPDRKYDKANANGIGAKPPLENVTLLLGDNGSGKTTVLQTIALSAFGEAAMEANLGVRNLVRATAPSDRGWGDVVAQFVLHRQDIAEPRMVESNMRIRRRGELEKVVFQGEHAGAVWEPIYRSRNAAFFLVAYGATRRVESGESLDMGARIKSRFLRAQRVQSVFQDSFSLIPLSHWLWRRTTPRGMNETTDVLNELLKPAGVSFTGKMAKRKGDFLFDHAGLHVAFQDLSDGYRAFIGWVADFLYHLVHIEKRPSPLRECQGVVLVDEIDLHLHPKWQMTVVETIAKTFPRMQFVFTSHSPLVAGSLQQANVIHLSLSRNAAKAARSEAPFHGLDADQILLTDLFGLKTTRAARKRQRLLTLTKKARAGDDKAAKQLVAELARGEESAP